ncbi:MAG: DUF4956 domain-containing protein [Pirellulaceae bacterium]
MLDWLQSEFTSVELDTRSLVVRLVLAWIGGVLVAAMAQSRKRSNDGDSFTLTLILMCVLISMATQIIGDNIARAFSLVGALSIVRFRTAVPATRDVAFVLAAVVVGMAIGAGQYSVAAFGLLVAASATFVEMLRTKPGTQPITVVSNSYRLTIETGLGANEAWLNELKRVADQTQLMSSSTIRKGSAIEFVYRITFKDLVIPDDFIGKLNGIPGIESVAIKRLGS